MPITLVRIDDRLIHGQVIESWIPFLRADRICIVSDLAASDETQKALMALAVPEHVCLDICSVAEAAKLLENDSGKDRILVIAPSPKEVLALLERGLRFEQVNVGGLHYSAGRVQLGKVVFISEEDRGALRQILGRGIAVEGRGVPSDEPMEMASLLS
jgi:mannose/fructose/N-acetylgalactosamine-specific phosphotransferase system component IIB